MLQCALGFRHWGEAFNVLTLLCFKIQKSPRVLTKTKAIVYQTWYKQIERYNLCSKELTRQKR